MIIYVGPVGLVHHAPMSLNDFLLKICGDMIFLKNLKMNDFQIQVYIKIMFMRNSPAEMIQKIIIFEAFEDWWIVKIDMVWITDVSINRS